MKFSLGDLIEYNDYIGIIDFIDTYYIVVRGCKVGPEGNPPRLVIFPDYQDEVKIIEKSKLTDDEMKLSLREQKYSCPVK